MQARRGSWLPLLGVGQGYKKNCMCLRYLHVAQTGRMAMVFGAGRNGSNAEWTQWTQSGRAMDALCACLCLAAYSLISRRIRPHVAKSFLANILRRLYRTASVLSLWQRILGAALDSLAHVSCLSSLSLTLSLWPGKHAVDVDVDAVRRLRMRVRVRVVVRVRVRVSRCGGQQLVVEIAASAMVCPSVGASIVSNSPTRLALPRLDCNDGNASDDDDDDDGSGSI